MSHPFYSIAVKNYLFKKLKTEIKKIVGSDKDINLQNINIEKLEKLKETIGDYITKSKNEISLIENNEELQDFFEKAVTNLNVIDTSLGYLIKHAKSGNTQAFKLSLEGLLNNLNKLSRFTKGEKGIMFLIDTIIFTIITGLLMAIIIPIIKSRKNKNKKNH